jgi:hypothetical protein
MRLEQLVSIISEVQIMGGSVAEMMVSSEIVAIAEAVLHHLGHDDCAASGGAARASWMAAIPSHMHDCFSS